MISPVPGSSNSSPTVGACRVRGIASFCTNSPVGLTLVARARYGCSRTYWLRNISVRTRTSVRRSSWWEFDEWDMWDKVGQRRRAVKKSDLSGRHRPRITRRCRLLRAALRSQVAADRLAHRWRDLRRQGLTRELGRAPVSLEEDHAIAALAQVLGESCPLLLRQGAVDVVETEIDELLTVDHGDDSG